MTTFARFATRDALLIGFTLIGWGVLSAYSAQHTMLAEFVAVLLGVAGGLSAWVCHEWGHWFAAKAVGAKLRAPKTVKSIYLFGFDNKQNSRLQFIVMALGGFAATGAVFALIMLGLPQDLLATKVVRGLVLLEILVTAILEVPGLIFGLVAYSKLPSVDVLGD